MEYVASKPWIVAGFGVLALLAGFLGVAGFRLGPRATHDKSSHSGHEEQAPRQQMVLVLERSTASAKGADIDVVTLPDTQALRRVQDHLGRSGEVAKQMSAVGGAYMSNPRRECIADTAAQTTAEVVKDLGDTTVGWDYIRGIQDYVFATDNLTVFALALPRNVKVIRLIEEARRRPEKVGPLVGQELVRLSETYRNVFALAEASRKAGGAVIGWDHPEIRQTCDEYAAFACLYVLVNIPYDGIMEYTAKFLSSDGSSMLRARGGRTFVCDALLRGRAEKYPNDVKLAAALARHMELVGRFKLDRGTRRVSRWNAPQDVHDSLLKMTGRAREVGQHIDMISVLAIPADIKKTITSEIETAVVRNFLDYCNELSKQKQQFGLGGAHVE